MPATSGEVSIIFFTTVTGAPVRISSTNFTLLFSLTTGIIKKWLSITRNKKKKHNKIIALAKNRLSSNGTLAFKALFEM